ncbi:hypothetical protein JCM8097_006756 [Rhodosporidiobolus ruineniae]
MPPDDDPPPLQALQAPSQALVEVHDQPDTQDDVGETGQERHEQPQLAHSEGKQGNEVTQEGPAAPAVASAPPTDETAPSPSPSSNSTSSSTPPAHPPSSSSTSSDLPPSSSPPPPPAPKPPPAKKRPHPPPPVKGILRPPSSSHAGPSSSRFSFRRDVLASLTAGAPAGAVAGGVQEAVGSAASVAGGWMGSALKRLGQAAAGAVAAQAQGEQGAGGLGVNVSGSAASLLSAASSSSSNTLVDPSSSSLSLAPSLSSPSSASLPLALAPAPAQRPTHPLPVSDLKKVRFRAGRAFKITYPINRGTLEVIAPEEEGETKEVVEAVFRAERRASASSSASSSFPVVGEKGKGREEKKAEGEKREWTGVELERLYAECCRMREEPGIEKVKRALREHPTAPPKNLDLSHTLLTLGAAEALADLLSVDWGLKKLTLEGCGLDDESLKPILHALLVSGSVPTVSLAGNKRIKQKGWKLVAIFVRKASFLRYLDLSETSLDRRSAEYLVQALNPQPLPSPPAPPPVEAPPTPPKPEEEDGEEGGGEKKGKKGKKVAGPWDEEEESEDEGEGEGEPAKEEGKEEKPAEEVQDDSAADEPVEEPPLPEGRREPLFETAPLLKDDEQADAGVFGAVASLRLENCNLRGGALEVLAQGIRTSQLKHISLRRNRINAQGAVHLAVMIRDYPLSSSTSSTSDPTTTTPSLSAPWSLPVLNGFQPHSHPALESPAMSINGAPGSYFERVDGANSVTAHQRPLPAPPSSSNARSSTDTDEGGVERPSNPAAQAEREAWRLSEARLRLRKQVDELPRVGALLTLDVKGNDLRNGVAYIAQVLKRNRTLKVLNLSENKVEPQGLIVLAEALKFNTCLETLDLSLNPCSGPSLDGVLALRSALMITPSLKRLFLNATQFTSEGAIALAEFLPELRALHHLDLTDNAIDISGVLALAVSLKLNSSIRCLDVQIPFDDPDFASLSQSIMESCIRNTELAQREAAALAAASSAADAEKSKKRVVVAQPIRKSALASNLEAQQRALAERERRREATARDAKERTEARVDIFAAAAEVRDVVTDLIAVDAAAREKGERVEMGEVVRDALLQAQLAEAQLAETVEGTRRGEQRERAELLLAELGSVLEAARQLYSGEATPAPPSPRTPVPPLPTAAESSVGVEEPSTADETPLADVDAVGPEAGTTESSTSAAPAPLHLDALSTPSSTLAPSSPSASPTRSPVESHARAMVSEESEVFRKSLALGVDDVPSSDESDAEEHDGEREVSGEELRREILEREVSEEEVREGMRRRGSRGSFGSGSGAGDGVERPKVERDGGEEEKEEEEEGGDESAVV